jgi:glycosyltransferase involved in cell wall biosynthesis
MLQQITPLILTYNESPNVGRMLERLQWAREIVVLDSFSEDDTLEVASRHPQVRVFQRRFDTHQGQWNFGLKETGISSEWVLALDADYLLTDELVEELKALEPAEQIRAYRARFVYCVNGRPLNGSAYPPVSVLYRRARAAYVQDGHTQRVVVPGEVKDLKYPILHDDRKPLSRWVQSQNRYMKLESEKIRNTPFSRLGMADRVRKMRVLAPFAMLFYCLLIKGVILDGKVGIYYAFQRMFSELLLSLCLIECDLRGHGTGEI